MEKTVKKYNLRDPAQERDDKEFWKNQSNEEKISVVENLRQIWIKMNPQWQKNADIKRFRRVFRIVKQV